MRLALRSLLFLSVLGLSFSGCKKQAEESGALRGSGIQATKTREIAAFSRLELGAKFHVRISIGALEPMELKGDDNLLEHVRARHERGALRLDLDTKVRQKMPLEVRLTVPELQSITSSESSSISIAGLKAKGFEASGARAAKFVAEGTAETLSLKGVDATDLDFTKVLARSAKIDLVKGATARVGYVEELDIRMRDASRLYYQGEPNMKKDVKRPAFLIKTK